MRIEYDRDVDAAYIYIEEPTKNGKVKKTIELNENIILDFDENNKLMGVEVLSASKILSKKVLSEKSF